MGEIAEWILEGGLCEGCGEYLGDSPGYARRCSACRRGEPKRESFREQKKREMHNCHADNCKRFVPSNLFMCGQHWKKVSQKTQQLIWKTYRTGQEIDKNPSKEWLEASRLARAEVSAKCQPNT
jgi:hypothetical protein